MISFRVTESTRRGFYSKLALEGETAQDFLEQTVQTYIDEEDTMDNHPLKIKKTKTGWVIEHDPDQLYTGSRIGQRYLYKVDTLAALGIDYNDAPYAIANEYGTCNIDIVWEQVEPDKVLSKGFIVQ